MKIEVHNSACLAPNNQLFCIEGVVLKVLEIFFARMNNSVSEYYIFQIQAHACKLIDRKISQFEGVQQHIDYLFRDRILNHRTTDKTGLIRSLILKATSSKVRLLLSGVNGPS